PRGHCCVAESNLTAAASRTTLLDGQSKRDSVAEIESLLQRHLILLVRPPPVCKEATNRRLPFVHLHPQRRGVPHGIRRVKAHERPGVAPVCGFKAAAHKLHQVGGRGLLRRHRPSIPRAGSSTIERTPT